MLYIYCSGVALRFNISSSSVLNFTVQMCFYLRKANCTKNYLVWPSIEEMKASSAYFLDRFGFPGVVALMDGSHIEIVAPRDHPNLFVNRKGFHSYQLLALCDHNMRFIFCYTGEVGSMHDNRVLGRSGLVEAIENGKENFKLIIDRPIKMIFFQV